MHYIKLRIEVNKEALDDLLYTLGEAGFESVDIDDPEVAEDIRRHPDAYKYDYLSEELQKDDGRRPSVSIYFADDEEGRAECARAEAAAKSAPAEAGITTEACVTGDDSEWLYKWQENFKPSKVGSRIVVKPSWESYEAKAGELVIEMNPGMAFGSGLHETTSLCIKALEKYLEPGDTVLDVGTGTGILAIAAKLLGAGSCLATDIDPESIRVSGENIKKNGLEGQIEVRQADLTEGIEELQADIIVANLMADLVCRLSPAAAEHIKPGGIYITSGILDIKEQQVSEAVRAAGFETEEVLHDGEWCAICATKK